MGAAEALILAKGYSATRVDEVCERAGVSKGSFYHFFSSKEDLGLAVLDAFYERNRRVMASAPTPGGNPRERALALADHLITSAGTLWGGGCLLGSLALELAESNPKVSAAVSNKFRDLTATLAEGFAPLAGAGDDAADIAEEFIVTVEGALVLARADGDWGYVERALKRFRRSLGASPTGAK
jgi:TetR/AcrR family transcriptional repressor of nem operon